MTDECGGLYAILFSKLLILARMIIIINFLRCWLYKQVWNQICAATSTITFCPVLQKSFVLRTRVEWNHLDDIDSPYKYLLLYIYNISLSNHLFVSILKSYHPWASAVSTILCLCSQPDTECFIVCLEKSNDHWPECYLLHIY